MIGIGGYLLLLQAQHHDTIERVKACLHLVFILIGTTVTQLDDIRQHLVVLRIIERELRRRQQLGVQLLQLLHHYLVDLQMSLFATALLIHHANLIAIPVCQFLLLILVVLKTLNILLANSRQRTVEGSDDILNLPHIQ